MSLYGDKSIVLEVVKCCFNLQALDMSHCYICSDGVTSLFCDHKSCVNLNTLSLCNNDIGSMVHKSLVNCWFIVIIFIIWIYPIMVLVTVDVYL